MTSRPPFRALLEQLAHDFARSVIDLVRDAALAAARGEVETLESPRLGVPSPGGGGPDAQSADHGAGTPNVLKVLTRRERDVFDRALHGASNREISRQLRVTIKTVETHRAKVNAKLGFHSGADLVRFGAIHGLLQRAGAGAGSAAVSSAQVTPQTLNLAALEKQTIAAALRVAEGDRERAAALLGLSRWELDTKVRSVVRAPPKPVVADEPEKPARMRRPRASGHAPDAVVDYADVAIVDPEALLAPPSSKVPRSS